MPAKQYGSGKQAQVGQELTGAVSEDKCCQREATLEQRQADLRSVETQLLELGRHAPADDGVLKARWECLAAEKRALAHMWECLASDKKSQADRERLMMAAALARVPAVCGMTRDAEAWNDTRGPKLACNSFGDMDALTPFMSQASAQGGLPFQHTGCALWSVQQIQFFSMGQQQQQADNPFASCCFQR